MTESESTLHYFAYGSNNHVPHLRMWLVMHGINHQDHVSEIRHAILHNYRLRTNYTTWDGSGACNIEPRPGAVVEGLLMTITGTVREVLRVKEGYPSCYDECDVEVIVGRTAIAAMTYIVVPTRQLPHNAPVSARYRALVLDGAREAGLSPRYQRHLRRVLRTLTMCEPQHSAPRSG